MSTHTSLVANATRTNKDEQCQEYWNTAAFESLPTGAGLFCRFLSGSGDERSRPKIGDTSTDSKMDPQGPDRAAAMTPDLPGFGQTRSNVQLIVHAFFFFEGTQSSIWNIRRTYRSRSSNSGDFLVVAGCATIGVGADMQRSAHEPPQPTKQLCAEASSTNLFALQRHITSRQIAISESAVMLGLIWCYSIATFETIRPRRTE